MRKQTVAVWVLAAVLSFGTATISALAAEGWAQSGSSWVYYDSNGNQVYNTWKKGADNQWRYVNGEGVMATNAWVDSDYYVDSNGIILTDKWLKLTNDEGEYEWYYFGSSGKMMTDAWKKIDNKWYHFSGDGRMELGWILDDMYYTGTDGVMRTGWQKLEPPDEDDDNRSKVTPGIDSVTDDDGKYWFYFSSSGKKFVPDSSDGDYTARSPERTRDEVGQLAHALNEMAARVERNVAELRETARRKQQLVDNVAHELRTPLTAVGGYAEYIQRAELSEEEKYEAAQYIVEEANRLAVMSERLLQMAALRGEQAARESVDVPALLEKAARTVAPKAAARGVALEPMQADACTVQGEAALLESLMVNLADNAVKACGPGGSVRLCARRETGRLTLTVQDTGRGMDAETLAHIGEPFYRPDKARSREQGGAGLGLALCFQIAQSHGAALSFTSAPGAGTTAAVIFTA